MSVQLLRGRQLVKSPISAPLEQFLVGEVQDGFPVCGVHPMLTGPEADAEVVRDAEEGIDTLGAQIGLRRRVGVAVLVAQGVAQDK